MEDISMKKSFFVVVLAMVLLGSCSQKQTVVGSWTDVEGITWVFGTDGKLAYANSPVDSREYRYSIFDGEQRTELTIYEVTYSMYIAMGVTDQKYTMEYSKDGKTLRLTGGDNLNGWSVAGPGWGTNQLVRQSNSARQPKPVKTAFTGNWSGSIEGENVILKIEGTTWSLVLDNDPTEREVLTASYNGNTANISIYGEEIGTATVSRNNLTLNIEGETFTFTKK
jgi:hypothetical protein